MYKLIQVGHETVIYDSNDQLCKGSEIDEFWWGMCNRNIEDLNYYVTVIINWEIVSVRELFAIRQLCNGFAKWQVTNGFAREIERLIK